MKYALLLWPHANARFAAGMFLPAQAELDAILNRIGIKTNCEHTLIGGMDALTYEADAHNARAQALVARHSLAYGLGEWRDDASIMPIDARARAYLGADMAGILKYKGKTNEQFTQQLINMALMASDYYDQSALTLLDPMCGRGTTLFQAVNRGYNAIGGDIDKSDISECLNFFKRYLEYHRFKHAPVSESRTLAGKAAVTFTGFRFADTPEAFKSGDTRALTLARADAADAANALARRSVHLICADLPYGIQHAPGEKGRAAGLDTVLARVVPAWKAALKPGGAISVAFNTHTLKTERARDIIAGAGLNVMRGGAYDKLTHWVEQAVTRDICVAVKP